jgi:AAA domain
MKATMTFEIRKAQRQGARLLIQLSGVSGSGKTYTALQLAYGLAGNDADKVVLIDTENRRGSLYANALPQPFNIIDFYAPFSPGRYIEAIEAACKAGAEVIVIDSVTHEWESEGGCEWIANQSRFPDWKRAKAEHKRFMTYMLQCPAHIIACTRAREKVDFSDPKNPRPLGVQPIQEKNFSYEATVSLMMWDQGQRQDVLKCPAELQVVLGRGKGYLSADDGTRLREWVDGAVKVDPAIEHHRGMLLNATEQGLQALQAAWVATPAHVRKTLGDKFKDQLKASAVAYDEARSASAPVVPGSVAALNSQEETTGDVF